MAMIRRWPASLLLAALVSGLLGCRSTGESGLRTTGSQSVRQPNVVLLMADDLGWGDVGFNGNPTILTPALDALAASGMRFDRFYAQAPVCSPTRGSCLTGRHPYRYGVLSANVGHLRADEHTLAELLSARGYATGHFGKWHLGTLTADYSGKKGRKPAVNHMSPAMAGFDEWFSTEYAVSTWDPYDPANKHGSYDVRNLYWDNGVNITDGEGEALVGDDSRIIVDRAVSFVRRAASAERPFFLVVWFHAPHAPVVGGPRYRALYPQASDDEQHYYGCITAMDEQVGRLQRELEALGVDRNTLVAFCSDNGPEGNPGPRGRNRGSAGPFRGRKRSLYEGGVRVPSLVAWPGRIAPGTSTSYPASTSDYLPTILDFVGGPGPSPRPLDGTSLRAALEGGARERVEPIFFQTRQQRTAVGTRFKLVHNLRRVRPRHDNGSVPFTEWELYDLLEDPGETVNVVERHAEVAASLRAELENFVASCHASLEQGPRD